MIQHLRDDDKPAKQLYSFPGYFLQLENERLEEEAKIEKERRKKARKEKKAKRGEKPKRKEVKYKKIKTKVEEIQDRMVAAGIIDMSKEKGKLQRDITIELTRSSIVGGGDHDDFDINDLPLPAADTKEEAVTAVANSNEIPVETSTATTGVLIKQPRNSFYNMYISRATCIKCSIRSNFWSYSW